MRLQLWLGMLLGHNWPCHHTHPSRAEERKPESGHTKPRAFEDHKFSSLLLRHKKSSASLDRKVQLTGFGTWGFSVLRPGVNKTATPANSSADNPGLPLPPESAASTVGAKATANTDEISMSTAATSDADPSSDDKVPPADTEAAAVGDKDGRKKDDGEDLIAKEHAEGSTAGGTEPAEPDADVVVSRLTEVADSFDKAKIRSRFFDNDDKAVFITNTIHSLQCILEFITEARRQEPQQEENAVCAKAKPEFQRVSWEEWRQHSWTSQPHQHASLYILTDEPPSAAARLTRVKGETEASSLHDRQGVRPLPARIRIASMAARRALDALCDGKLRYGQESGLVLLRPYKLLVHLDEEIRKRRDKLREACHVPTTGGGSRTGGSESDGKAANTEPNPNGDIFSPGTNWDNLTLEERVEAADDLDTVVSFMDQYLKPMEQLGARGENAVYFNELWHLLRPGSLVYVKDRTTPQKVWRVLQGIGGRRPLASLEDVTDQLRMGASWQGKALPLQLDCYYIDFNGSSFVRVFRTFSIEEFTDLRQINSLPILPFHIAEEQGLVNSATLLERGAHFCECTLPSYNYYRGRSLCYSPKGELLRRPERGSNGNSTAVLSEAIESPVVVDFERCLQAIPDWMPEEANPELSKADESEVVGDPTDYVEDDRIWDVRLAESILDFKDPGQRLEKHGPLTKDDMLLLPDRVFAFVLRTRRWGKGLIILLHGVPGVGKTSTAETVAEYYNKPLLPITCGDLGLTPTDVEANLQTSFQMAQAWDCVLLLDEADVFLAERSRDNVERNALVSVFLRVLEYYEGILFLTTNKVGAFDEAFKSRVSMALYYPALDSDQTIGIWRTQMRRMRNSSVEAAQGDRLQHIEFDEGEILMYATQLWALQRTVPQLKPVWNGRQIRNAFQTAIALAEYHRKEGECIQVKKWHFEHVAAVSNEFNEYLWHVKHKRDESDLALRNEFRYDKHQDGVANHGGVPGMGMATSQPFPQNPHASHLMMAQAHNAAANPGANFGTNPLGANLQGGVNTLGGGANMAANLSGMPSTLAQSGGMMLGAGALGGGTAAAVAPGTATQLNAAADYGQSRAFNYGELAGYQGYGVVAAGSIAGMGGGGSSLPQQGLQGLRPEQQVLQQHTTQQNSYPQMPPASQWPQGSSMPPGAQK
ncbi:hypothetical protein MAPG_00078 [Magnaporthiopsis poae ATCC 64411]|uniref:AAA+ ATPase domain-containing protein n=1 Tax=Magnaporthiopsis poae (strain ATCC 64411 / 73-15) TaxID=644358 RepID=A0A0C4DK15_MAGP6|nr:hypothetical protein MAPG_00078 [Magnaporthiopsis poae ATCC 64411]